MTILEKLDRVEHLLKHIPGRHDQRRHGWRYGAVSAGTLEYWDRLANKMGKGEFHEYSKRWQAKFEAGAFEPKKTEHELLIERRKALGHDNDLDAESQKYWEMAIDDIKPLELKDSVDDIQPVKQDWAHGRNLRGYFITKDDRLAEITDEFGGGTNDHVGFMALSSDPSLFGLTEKEANNLLADYMDMGLGSYENMGLAWDKAFQSGTVRVREFGTATVVQSQRMDNRTLRRMQRLYDQNKFAVNWDGDVTWEDMEDGNFVTVPAAEFLGAGSVGELRR